MLKHINRFNKKAVLAFIFCAMFISGSCGKRKPPLPPVERVAQRVEIKGIQRGNQILLSWTMAPRNAADGSVLNISRADIYRLTEPANSPLTLSEEEFASRSTLITTIEIKDSDFGGKQMTFNDTLNFAGQSARIRYAIRFVNAAGQKAGFSNFLVIDPTAKVASVPTEPVYDISQSSINIRWKSPLQNIDGSTPANILGFNVYRLEETKNPAKILNNSPVTKPEFADKVFEFDKPYSYFIRTVSLGADGNPVESLDSEIIKVTPKDIFPPAPPGAVTIAAAPTSIAIFFASNLESDIAGYRIYRSIEKDLPKPQWDLLTPELLTTNTFQDTNVESGKTYYYYLTAVDKFGNQSENSEVVSETVP